MPYPSRSAEYSEIRKYQLLHKKFMPSK